MWTPEWTPETIKALRKARGEKQSEFCKHFRLSIDAVQMWEQAKGPPSAPATVILDQLAAQTKKRRKTKALV